jgi:RNA recognition motif-containing protein
MSDEKTQMSSERTNEKSSKRKPEDGEDLEIDLEAPEPLSKKQKRLLKKGKIDEAKKSTSEQERSIKKSPYGVWIGNMSYDTAPDELKRYLIAKTASNDEDEKITEESITRINMLKTSKGCAYVDFTTQKLVDICVALSESHLNGRNLLIKDNRSFEGRPLKTDSKNPPSRILFVGNLPFDTTDQKLETFFQHCGEIVKIRMATFEDSGKCKGFAFVDFLEEAAATKALGDKRCRMLDGRKIRMEYGEDRSKRTKQQKQKSMGLKVETELQEREVEPPNERPQERATDRPKQRHDKPGKREIRRTAPGLALANAQRAKVGIVPSAGKKITFD